MSIPLLLVEYSLLEGNWRTKEIPSELNRSKAVAIAQSVIDGKFKEVLTDPSVKPLFTLKNSDNLQSDGLLPEPINAYLDVSHAPFEAEENELLWLSVGVACLHAFVQVNWVGPDLDITPASLLLSEDGKELSISEEALNRQTISSLALGGEPAYHLAKVTTFLQIAQILFNIPYKCCKSAPWWRLRASALHQQLLDEPVTQPQSFFDQLDSLTPDLQLRSYPDLAGRLILEIGLLRHTFSQDKLAAEKFVEAARTMELKYLLTGAMGKRTKFQTTDLSQLVLLAESRKRIGDEVAVEESMDDKKDSNVPETLALNDDTLLEHTEFTSSSAGKSPTSASLSHINPASQPPLHQLDQCVFLAMCLNVKNTSPAHGLTSEQMSPYVSRVISHPKNWSIHTMALLIRSRLEAHRTRTVERSTLQLQALIDQMPTADSSLSERLQYFHSIPLPSKWEMEKELGIRFLSLGVVRSAMEIFERLEMWEEVVKCWQSLDRPEKGVEIVKDLLKGDKQESEMVTSKQKENTRKGYRPGLDVAREAKLWCMLGDLEPQSASEHYQRAWDVSKGTSGRAMRSLGGYHFARSDFEQAASCLRQAVAINPLQSRSWFILGCSLVRKEEWDAARDAFARCVAIDEEDGESWSNLASVYLRMGEENNASDSQKEESRDPVTLADTNSKSMPFSNKYLAFRALKQGLKFRYDNWRMWSNYMVVAMDVGELGEACRALGRIVEECAEKTGDSSVDHEVLERLVDAVTRTSHEDDSTPAPQQSPRILHGLSRQVMDLFTRIILPRVSSSPRIFRAYARLLMWQESWGAALEAHLNAYRASVANDTNVETDLPRWREAVVEVEELVDVLRNLGPRAASETVESSGGARKGTSWQFQARGVVRTFMGRTRDAFEQEPEWTKLAAFLDDLRT